MQDDSFDAIWELAEFAVREAGVLRSFLSYLKDWPDPPEKKLARIQQWKHEVGLQLGNPTEADAARGLFRKLRAAPPEVRRQLVKNALAEADEIYLGFS
jgi:hypothetical protein